ncbi:T9SS type A sorting domain-containing protein [candidate division WOR-3 bacterium]|nr:T9SS type A sorting domain-containing protein [candidate division WOR-3 bacterium]
MNIRVLWGIALLFLGVRLMAIPPEWCDKTYSWCGDALNGPIELSNPYGGAADTLEIHLIGWSHDASVFCSTMVVVPPKGDKATSAGDMGFGNLDCPFSIHAYTVTAADTFGCNTNPHGANGDMPPRPHGGPEAIGLAFQSGVDHIFIHNPRATGSTVFLWAYTPAGTLCPDAAPDTIILNAHCTVDHKVHPNLGAGYDNPSYIIQSKNTTDSIVVTIGVGNGSYMPFGLGILSSESWTVTMDNKSEIHMFNPDSSDTVIFQIEYWYWAGDSTAGRRHPSADTTVFYQDTILPLHHIQWCPDDFGGTAYQTWVLLHIKSTNSNRKYAIVDRMTVETSDAIVPPTSTYYRFWWAINNGANGEVAIANCANDSTPVICNGWNTDGGEYSSDTTWLAPYEYKIQGSKDWVGWGANKNHHSMQGWAADWSGMIVWAISPMNGRLIPQLYGEQTPVPYGIEETYEPFKPEVMFNAYPNPARGTVKFLFDSYNSDAKIVIHNISGRRVKTFDNLGSTGYAKLKLVNEQGKSLPSGVYFATLYTSDGFFNLKKTVKLTLVR